MTRLVDRSDAGEEGAANASQFLLDVVDLHTHFQTRPASRGRWMACRFTIQAGQTLAVVGESGSGKTVTALSLLRLIPTPPGRIVEGQILFEGRDLVTLSESEMSAVRGGDIAMIFQEPAMSLNPIFTIGDQIADAVRLHVGGTETEIRGRVLEVLEQVRMSDPQRRMDHIRTNYPAE